MSLSTLPLLFINLGGEMMYILDQRLRAQEIPIEKSRKVMHDITSTMFNARFMEQMFKPQEVYSKKAMRLVFDRLAHASIMRLNAASMDKLYDLMTMAFKHQVSLVLRPRDILLVTLNHMDAIRRFVDTSPVISTQVDNVYCLLIHNYTMLNLGEYMLIRQSLLNFFQDIHIRVSIFLKDRVQTSNGRFSLPKDGPLPWGTELPGTIRYYNRKGELKKTAHFKAGDRWQRKKNEGSFDVRGERDTKLGTNMYKSSNQIEAKCSHVHPPISRQESKSEANPLAKAQLDLLSKLIRSSSKEQSTKTRGKEYRFHLNLFDLDSDSGGGEDEDDEATARYGASGDDGLDTVRIDASRMKENAQLNAIMRDFDEDSAASHSSPGGGAGSSRYRGRGRYDDDDEDDDDLLRLMDSAI